MPLIVDEPAPDLRLASAPAEPDPFKPAPTLSNTLDAAFRMENTISNVVSMMNRPIYAPEPGFNPIAAVRGTKYERDHLESFLPVQSAAEMRDVMARIDREDAENRMLDDAGAWGTAARVFAGMLDPLLFMPIGGAVRSVRGGYSAARSAGVVGATSALQAGVSELALQAAQETRSGVESAVAIGTAGILGGLIGGGAAALLTRAERQALEGLVDQDRRLISEIVEGSPSLPASAGAAATDQRQLKLVGYGLDKIPGVSSLVEKMSPTLRVFSSDNVSAKRAMADLAETALRFADNERGITTSFNGPPVSRLVQAQKIGMQLEAAETLKEAFTVYRFGQADVSAPIARAAIDDLRGVVEEGKLSFNEFKREVTTALFSGDTHAIPQVEQAAKSIRANILEPIRQKAIELKLLDPDAAPKGDPSWFARVWNREKLTERRPDAVKRFADWLEGEQTRKAAAQERLSVISDELDAVDTARARLEAQVQRLEAATQKLEGQIAERAVEARRASARTDVLAERRALLAEEQSEIEEFITAMRAEVRDPALRERIAKLERDFRAMRRQDERARVSDADLERIDREEAAGALSDRVGKIAADIVLGNRRPVKEPSFVHFIARNGGIRESQGDVFNVVGSTRAVPGLISKTGRSVDEWGEFIMDRFRLQERPSQADVLEWIDEALRGRQPGFWLDSFTGEQHAAFDATRFAASLNEAMDRAGFTPKTREDVAAFLRGEDASPRTLDDLDRALAEMEGAAIPPSVRLEGVEGELTLARGDLASARAAVQRGLRGREEAGVRERVIAGRQREAAINRNFNEDTIVRGKLSRGRLGILNDRQAAATTRRELLDEAIRLQDAAEAEIMARVERELQEWGGKSASEALSAIKARDKAAAEAPTGSIRVYHGSRKSAPSFDPERSTYRTKAVWFSTDRSTADGFREGKGKTFVTDIPTRDIFDFRNETQLARVDKALGGAKIMHNGEQVPAINLIRAGEWSALEDDLVQSVLRREGFKGHMGIEGDNPGISVAVYDKGLIRSPRDADTAPPRLASADKPTLSAVRRILDSDRTLSRQEMESRANEIVDRILSTPDGRLPYDAASGGAKSLATPETGEMRGSLRSRDFAIPTNLVRDLIEDDPEHILSTVARTILPDMALVERFGDVDMTEVMKRITEESAAKAARTTDPKKLAAIEKEKQALLRDVAATRDRIRGTYGFSQDSTGRNIARFASLAKNVNVVTDLGTSTLNSMGDAAGVVFRHGFVNTFRDGWAPFFSRMLSSAPAGASDMRQLRAMKIAVETQLNLRQHSVADIAENYRPGTRWERAVQWAADKSQIVNGQSFWTDWTKSIAATVGSAEMLRATERVGLGKASGKDIAKLAEAGIDDAMARRIHKAFADGGGQKIDGARLPNTGDWKDRGAARAFESALQREVDIAVVTPGLEKPLWMSRPIASMLGQFKAFVAAANERMLIANLQRSDWNTLQGLFASVALGMLSYRLYTAVSGQKASERPQDWVKEGISRSGVLGWFDEINSTASKFTRGQADAFRLIGADKPLTRMQSRGILGTLAGPTAGKLEKLAQIGGAASTGEWTASDTTAVRRLMPFQNLFYLRRLLDEVEKGANASFGVPERAPR